MKVIEIWTKYKGMEMVVFLKIIIVWTADVIMDTMPVNSLENLAQQEPL